MGFLARQGVRWRFQILFNQVYVEAFLTILMIEMTFGTRLREHALRIGREGYAVQPRHSHEVFKADSELPRQ